MQYSMASPARVDPACAEGGVERARLAFQDARRPAVGNDVVQGDEEHVLALREPDRPPQARDRIRDRMRRGSILDGEPSQRGFGVGLDVEVMLSSANPDLGGDALDPAAVYSDEVARSASWRATRRSSARLMAARSRSPCNRSPAGCDKLG